jgi:hypothetical protein
MPHKADWRAWARDLPKEWSIELQRTVLLCAAMLSCQVPLSSLEWASERFLPVLVRFTSQIVLGLLAKHAHLKWLTSDGKASMACVGRPLTVARLARTLCWWMSQLACPSDSSRIS